jgi:hypothetical protein
VRERHKILGKAELSQADEDRLEVLSIEISEMAAVRPVEFGALTVEDFRAMNIVNRAAKFLD